MDGLEMHINFVRGWTSNRKKMKAFGYTKYMMLLTAIHGYHWDVKHLLGCTIMDNKSVQVGIPGRPIKKRDVIMLMTSQHPGVTRISSHLVGG